MAATPLDRLLSGVPAACFPDTAALAAAPVAYNGAPAHEFWEGLALARSSVSPLDGRTLPGPSTALPSLARCKSVCLLGQLPEVQPVPRVPSVTSTGDNGQVYNRSNRYIRRVLQHSSTLPPLKISTNLATRQKGAGDSGSGNSPQRSPFPRTTSMFALPRSPPADSKPAYETIYSESTSAAASYSPSSSPPVAALCRGLDAVQLSSRIGPGPESEDRRRSASGGGEQGGSPPSADEAQGQELEGTDEEQLLQCKGLEDFSALRVIASNKHSTVWEAVPKAMSQGRRTVAVKAYSTVQLGARALARLRLEQHILRSVRHQHIIQGLGGFEEDGYTFLVMEHADGRSVHDYIGYWRHRNQADFEAASETTVVPEADAASLVVAPLLEALAFLHTQGIVHRDIKATNAVFTSSGTVKLIDFGLSLDTGAAAAAAEPPCCQIGTPQYWAPELVGEDPLPLHLVDRTDCWAVGVLTFQLLAGCLPFHHEVRAILLQMVAEAAVPVQTLELMGASPAAKDFILQALTKDPARRPDAARLRTHPWLLQHCGGQPLEGNQFAA